jgi:ABC-2 type transport system ATP-binding protein
MTFGTNARPAVAIDALTKRYGERLALDGVSLRVAPGELHGLLGPNGAGKTTLLRTLFGLIRPDSGAVELLGRSFRAGQPTPRDGVAGFVEEPAFYPYLSGSANLSLLARLDDGPPSRIEDVLERVGLRERARDRVAGYSTGMRQRLGIAAALLRSPRLLLLDEPTSGLDPAGTQAVSRLLRDLSAQGVAVILSSHLIGELEALCHSYTIIRSGRVVWNGDASRLEADAPGAVYTMDTSDNERALRIADGRRGIAATLGAGPAAAGRDGSRGEARCGIRLVVEPDQLGEYVLALGREEVAVLRLELLISPLKTLFFALTGDGIDGIDGLPVAGPPRVEAPEQVAVAP